MTMGWFWLWIAMNAVLAIPDGNGYLIFVSGVRAILSFLGVTLVIVVVWLVGYAVDERGDKSAIVLEEGTLDSEQQETVYAFGQAGHVGGSLWEIKVAVSLAWLVLAVAPLLPWYRVGPVLTLTSATIVLIGILAGQVLEHLSRRNMVGVLKWSQRLAAGLVALGILTSCKGVTPAVLVWLALACLVGGCKIMDKDRKRGLQWLVGASEDMESSVVVYSLGVPLFTLGFILLAWSIAI